MKDNLTLHQIECRGISLSYDGHTVLENVSFFVDSGDYLCIVGENGSGKSTLAKALLSLKKPYEGEILFGDSLSRRDIGYLPQQTNIQRDFPATVREVVLSGCLSRGGAGLFYSAKDKKRAAICMEKMGVLHIEKSCYRDLSGGQQQRVLLARALCAADKMLILDEPVTGLDPLVTKDMYGVVEKLNREEGITVVMVSHDVSSAAKYATKLLHLDRSIKFFGTKEEYLASTCFKSFSGGDTDE